MFRSLSYLTAVFLGICICASGVLAQPASSVVATVNGYKLIATELDQEIQKIMPMNRSFHGAMSKEKNDKIRSEAMEKLIDLELKFQDARAKGMKLSEAEISAVVDAYSKRNTSGKNFSAVLAESGFNDTSFARFIERNVLSDRIRIREVDDKVSITDKDVEEYYKKNSGRYSKPEEMRASHILVKVEPSAAVEERALRKQKADEILKKIKAGGDFSELAYAESDDLTRIKGGDIGFFHSGQALPEFESVLAAMKVGGTSDVIETIYGYHIIRLTEKRPARQLPFAEVREKIKKELTDAEKSRLQETWMSGLKKKAVISYPSEK
ncbi:MAG: peptidylprolyl isomerase [Desulfuromonadales bacterium]